MLTFTGRAQKLVDTDLPRIGAKIGVGEDELHAFLEVETIGGGFDGHGRPKMLFEPHIFYRHLSGAKLDRAIAASLAYPNWKPGNYPKDSYPRLQAAIAIDEAAALKSASWGIGQVLGENHVAAGYNVVQAMVAGFVELGEAEQLEAAVRFISYNHLDDELRSHNWAGFARGYNGAQYAKHGYHLKLAAAFAKWRRIRDTPWPGPALATTLGEALRSPGVTPDQPAPVAPRPPQPNPTPAPIRQPEPVAVPPNPAPPAHSSVGVIEPEPKVSRWAGVARILGLTR